MPRITTIAPLAAGLLVACAPPATDARFDSPNPASRLYAIEKAMRTRDAGATRQLVEQLDSDDPAVRMLAIEALERATGETRGYRFDDPAWKRRAAIQRWVEAVEAAAPGTASELRFEDG